MSTALTMAEAVPLGYVLCDRVARNAGIRLLAIKGPVLAQQGLRSERQSADVDVLVDPAAHGSFLAAMDAVGWVRGPASTAPTIIPMHSKTLRNPLWPLEIDAHDRFPGFLASSEDTFEALWRTRTSVSLGGADVWAPGRPGHAAIVGLHHLRDPFYASSKVALDSLEEHFRAVATPEELEALVALAGETGSVETLAPLLSRLDAPAWGGTEPSASAAALQEWDLRISSPGSVPWLVSLSRLPVWRWPAEVWHAIWLSDFEVDAFHRGPHDESSRLRLRLRRLRRGMGQLPKAAADYLRTRRRHHRGR
ncbi:MAG: nucleotidyltransferase family protein [Nocardioides sp.]|uniref:nucleotidyltransferase family protein n=1 Tax=Nocardioides sp. TaxID=35761 RepID=UPI0039E466F7